MSPEELGGDIPDQNIQTEDLPELILAYDVFRVAESNFLDACDGYTQEQTAETDEALGTYGTALALAFRGSIYALFESEPSFDDRIETAADILRTEHQERTRCLQYLTGCRYFKDLEGADGDSPRERLIAGLTALANHSKSDTDFIESLTGHFTSNVQIDVTKLRGHMQRQHQSCIEEQPVSKRAIGVAIMAAGVLVAGWALRPKRR